MNQDRELLEKAARAAGLSWIQDANVPASLGLYLTDRRVRWSPLTDDGDALRLAVNLKIDVMHTNIRSQRVHAMGDYEAASVEDAGADPYAATRRAIVRAAAALGDQP